MKAGVPAIKTSSVQFLYNPLQVVLCSYMCMEAGILAYRNVRPLTCPFKKPQQQQHGTHLSSFAVVVIFRATRPPRATRSTLRSPSWAT